MTKLRYLGVDESLAEASRLLGGDQDTGSLTVEFSEVRNSGSNGGNHAIYMATDEVAYPGAVFRLRHSYLHDSRFDDARDILRESPGVNVIDKRDSTGYITPKEAQGEFPVFVSRIRTDPTVEHGLNMWVVADNLRKGAALNAVQIAELLAERGLIRQKAIA